MKENFDDIIRRRWEEQQFPVDDAHRQEMARLLEGEKKRRGFIFWWFGGAGVTLLLALALFMYNTPQEKAKAEENITEMQTNSPFQGVGGEVAELKTKAEVENAKIDVKKSSTVKNSKSSTRANTVKKKETVKQQNVKDQTHSEIKPRTEDTENTEKLIANNEIPIDPLQGVGGESDPVKGVEGESDPVKGVGSKAPPGGYKVELENPNQVSILSKEAAIQVFPDSIEYDPWTNAIYRDGTVRSLNKTRPVDALTIHEVESLKKNAPGAITPHTKMTHPIYFIAETGLGFVLASKPLYDGGIKFNVGGGLGMKLKPRVHLQLTGGYQMQDGGFDFERTSSVNSLSFGVRSQFNSLKPDRLHFIYGKLGAAYRFQKSTLEAHMGVQWLYGSQGNIIVHEQSQVPPGSYEESRYAWLSTDGLRKTQWWSDVSYGYMILPKLYLHGGVTFYYSSLIEAAVPDDGYDWNGKTANVQPFITLNYLLHANF